MTEKLQAPRRKQIIVMYVLSSESAVGLCFRRPSPNAMIVRWGSVLKSNEDSCLRSDIRTRRSSDEVQIWPAINAFIDTIYLRFAAAAVFVKLPWRLWWTGQLATPEYCGITGHITVLIHLKGQNWSHADSGLKKGFLLILSLTVEEDTVERTDEMIIVNNRNNCFMKDSVFYRS